MAGALSVGRWITLKDLQPNAELNGLTGEIINVEAAPGRAGVLVHKPGGTTKVCSIKYENLSPFPDNQTVMAVRLSAKREFQERFPFVLETRVPRELVVGIEDPCPVPRLCGIPLMVAKMQPFVKLGDQGDYDNQWATYLMIDPKSGFAPLEWQSYVGPVVAYRDDGEDFSCQDMSMLNNYLSALLDRYPEGNVTGRDLTPQAFQRFQRGMNDN